MLFYKKMKELVGLNEKKYTFKAIVAAKSYYVFLNEMMYRSDLTLADAEEIGAELLLENPTAVITIICQKTEIKAVRRLVSS